MERLLGLLLRRFVRRGTLRITTANGSVFSFGDGTGRPVAIRFMTAAAQRGAVLDPEIRLGEAYMDGTLRVEQGTIADFLALVLGQSSDGMPPRWARIQWTVRYVYRRLQQLNRPTRARRNVAHHYDLDGRLYSLFLDADRQYSCAYFETPDQSLDDAQLAKKRHIAAKLLINDGHRVLDIGSGWGGLALYLAETTRANVTGITLSREQWQRASEHAGLLVTDIEILRLHYAETLKAWRDRFMAHREKAERIYDRCFVRMWEFYLAASEMAFREAQAMMVMQFQLTKRQNVVPITRDYIMREEARLRALEVGQRPPLRLAGE